MIKIFNPKPLKEIREEREKGGIVNPIPPSVDDTKIKELEEKIVNQGTKIQELEDKNTNQGTKIQELEDKNLELEEVIKAIVGE